MDVPRASTIHHRLPVLPSGTVTFAFTDIEASTARWERDPAAMGEALRRHDAIVRAAVSAHRGIIFKTIGDAFCCAFADASDAVASAVAFQRALADEDFSTVDGLRVRAAIHTGTADERDGDYFGPTLNRVARLLATAHGGQTIVSGATAALVRASLADGVRLVDLGTHHLKDLRDPEDVYGVAIAGMRSDFPALTSQRSQLGNLPLSLTTFIGRRGDLTNVRSLLADERLVTIVGAGGVGKTRISLEIGATLRATTPGGVWFVDLAPVPDAGYLTSALATTLGIRTRTDDGDILHDVVAAIAQKRLVLIVDNCEHVVVAAAAAIAAILRDCPNARILATSREPLRVPGECAYRLPSLHFPAGDVVTCESALDFESIALFVARAKSAKSTFACTDENVGAIAELCRRLDGIALAIELAAARMNVLSPGALVARLDERFRLLGGTRAVLPRQQTMRALIDWSYDILTDVERAVMRRCAVFTGGWSREWATDVITGDDLDAIDVADALLDLVAKSLLNVRSEETLERYAFPESIRLYALEKLGAAGEGERFERRLAEHVADVCANLAAESRRNGPSGWRVAMHDDLENLRAAIEWSLGPRGDRSLAMRIVADTAIFLVDSRLRAHVRHYLDAAIARVDETTESQIAAKLWLAASVNALAPDAIDAGRRAIALAVVAGRDDIAVLARTQVGFALWRTGRADEAERELRAALDVLSEPSENTSWPYANGLDALASVIITNDAANGIAEATEHYERASLLFARLGDALAHARVESNLAELEFAGGRIESALQRALGAARELRAHGSLFNEANALVNAAGYLVALERYDEAYALAAETVALSQVCNAGLFATVAIQHIASVLAHDGEPERAARLLGYVDAWYVSHSLVRDPSENIARASLESSLHDRLSDEAIARALATGSLASEEAAVADALARRRTGAPSR